MNVSTCKLSPQRTAKEKSKKFVSPQESEPKEKKGKPVALPTKSKCPAVGGSLTQDDCLKQVKKVVLTTSKLNKGIRP